MRVEGSASDLSRLSPVAAVFARCSCYSSLGLGWFLLARGFCLAAHCPLRCADIDPFYILSCLTTLPLTAAAPLRLCAAPLHLHQHHPPPRLPPRHRRRVFWVLLLSFFRFTTLVSVVIASPLRSGDADQTLSWQRVHNQAKRREKVENSRPLNAKTRDAAGLCPRKLRSIHILTSRCVQPDCVCLSACSVYHNHHHHDRRNPPFSTLTTPRPTTRWRRDSLRPSWPRRRLACASCQVSATHTFPTAHYPSPVHTLCTSALRPRRVSTFYAHPNLLAEMGRWQYVARIQCCPMASSA